MNNNYTLNCSSIEEGFPHKTNMLQLICKTQDVLKDSVSEAALIVNAMNDLRTLNKFHQELFIISFDNVYDSLSKFMFSENPAVVQITFFLLNEIFSKEWITPRILDWIDYFLPHILTMTAYEEDNKTEISIKQLSIDCLFLNASKGFYQVTVFGLLEGMMNENELITLNASKALYTYMTRVDKIYLMNVFNWEDIFCDIFELYIQRDKRKLAEGFIKALHNEILGPEDFETILTKIQDDELLQTILHIIPFNYKEVRDRRKKETQIYK